MQHLKHLTAALGLFLSACDSPAPVMNAEDQLAMESAITRMILALPDIEEDLRASLRTIGKDVWCRGEYPQLEQGVLHAGAAAYAFEIFQHRIEGLTAGEIISLAETLQTTEEGGEAQDSCGAVIAAASEGVLPVTP